MKITGINPTVITSKYDDAIKLFESLGFEIRHHSDHIDDRVPISTRLKNEDGFIIDIRKHRTNGRLTAVFPSPSGAP